ncbi:MAG TPA: coproporphyrinogen III oxidase [Pontiella sp.]
MKRICAESHQATEALLMVEFLQTHFVQSLEKLGKDKFEYVEWLRDGGRHGGGQRFGIEDSDFFGRASVNVSQVHYDDEAVFRFASASAISAIVHPAHPNAPSLHLHISWTELKGGSGYWRVMADLNPSIPNQQHTERFLSILKKVAPSEFVEATVQGDQYFYIPALERHRGVAHFYLENYNSGDFEVDFLMAKQVGISAIDTYVNFLEDAVRGRALPTEEQKAIQLAYHTLYFFQVLTLDRGTTMGLLVHNENDAGILGSLPPKIDKNLLCSWRSRVPEPQDRLVDKLVSVLPDFGVCTISTPIKLKLAEVVREHYFEFPEALKLQAAGDVTPPTIRDHD